MKRSTLTGALALLTVVSLGVATLALARRQRMEARIVELDRRAAATKSSARPATIRDHPTTLSSPAAVMTAPAAADESPKRPTRSDKAAILAAHPELQVAYQRAKSGQLRHTYSPLFVRLGLSPAQVDQAVTLLVRDAEREFDLAMAAQALELPKDDSAVGRFGRSERFDTETELEMLLGAQGMQAWRDYHRVLGMQATAEDVASLTVAANTPMTGAQMEQLMRVLAEASATFRTGGSPEWATTDWAEVLRQASTFLAPPHLAALQAKSQQAKAAILLSQFYASRPSGK
jgi:hypothetical protein